MKNCLNISEMLFTISGEVGNIIQGSPIMLVRLQGCNMICPWCDAKKSKSLTATKFVVTPKILGIILASSPFPILITGGEPLLQASNLIAVLDYIATTGIERKIQIETNGSIPIPKEMVRDNVSFVVDYKMEYEGEMVKENFKLLRSQDYLKVLVNDDKQVEKVPLILNFLKESLDDVVFKVAISCTDNNLYAKIVDLVLDNSLPVILNVQIHKQLNVA